MTSSIFVVEDEIITAKSIAENIKLLGYEVAGIATNSTKAVAQIIELKPDLVLMDILLKKSDLDGISTAAKIQEQINIPVVYITAHSDEETLERAKNTTPFGYILKPYTKKDLQIAIKLALYKHYRELKLIEREKLYFNILNSTQNAIIATNNSETTNINLAAKELTELNLGEAINKKASQQYPARFNINLWRLLRKILNADSISAIFASSDRTEDAATTISQISAIEDRLSQVSCELLELIVHELRTPLTIILSTSQSLRLYGQRWTPQKQDKSFEQIQRAVKQITRLLDNISLWEQANASELSFQPELINVVSLCQNLLSDLHLVTSDRHQIIFIHEQIGEAIAYIDPALFTYILNNLFLNAIKYSDPDSTIHITLERQPNNLILKVRDEGIGIPPQEQPHLFKSFYRASNVGDVPGTGLGLAIAKMCAEIHQGTIDLKSEVGIGTTFTVTLAIAKNRNY